MKVAIEVRDKKEADAIKAGLADPVTRAVVIVTGALSDPVTRAVVIVTGALSALPTERAIRRVMAFIADRVNDEATTPDA